VKPVGDSNAFVLKVEQGHDCCADSPETFLVGPIADRFHIEPNLGEAVPLDR
jgi:hypothetical protein